SSRSLQHNPAVMPGIIGTARGLIPTNTYQHVQRRTTCVAASRRSGLLTLPAALLASSMLMPRRYASGEVKPIELTEALPPAEMYARYTYQEPADITRYITDRAAPGDSQAVLQAIDEFATAIPMYRHVNIPGSSKSGTWLGPEKGAVLEAAVALARPQLVVELGSFVGYSATRIARALPPGGRLVCVEANPNCVAALDAVLQHAGLRERVVIEQGLARDVLPHLAAKYGPAQMVFEDHCKDCYLPDLLLAEDTGLVVPGTWVLADNVLYPGAPDLLAHIATPSKAGYAAVLVAASYEYSQPWNPAWKPPPDAVSVAVRGVPGDRGAQPDGQAHAQLSQ
ncbi:hypothetical protein QJQ45_028020, partial [Haematococcus lacustris]